MKSVNILMLTFYLTDIAEMVLDRLRDATNYPYRLFVADNLSDMSPNMRKMLKGRVDSGEIDAAFFMEQNHLNSAANLMFSNVPHADFTILTDQDAFLPKIEPCWLTRYMQFFEEYENLLMLGFHSKEGNLLHNGMPSPKVNNDLCLEGMYAESPDCHCNGHFQAFPTWVLNRYADDGRAFYDGGFRSFIKEIREKDDKPYVMGRFDAASVSNLSTTNTTEDYKTFRRTLLKGGKSQQGYSFRELHSVTDYEVYDPNGYLNK